MTGVLIFCTRGSGRGSGEKCIHMLFSEESVELTSSSRSFIFWLRGRRSSTAGRAMLQWLELVGECCPYGRAMHSELSGFQKH